MVFSCVRCGAGDDWRMADTKTRFRLNLGVLSSADGWIPEGQILFNPLHINITVEQRLLNLTDIYLAQKNKRTVIFYFRKGAILGYDWSGLLQSEVLSGPIDSFCKLSVIEPRQSSEILMVDMKNQRLRLVIKPEPSSAIQQNTIRLSMTYYS